MKTTGIVICNYNKCDYVLDCIQSVLESKTEDYDIFVVDNASTDDSVKMIEERYGSRVNLLVNSENLGGSGGFNTGIRKAMSLGYRYIWCLDNDVLVDEHALESLVDFLDNHPSVGMVGSKVVHMEETDVIQQYGLTVHFDDFSVEAKYYNRYDDESIPAVVYSDAVAACSVLVRSSLIKIIGPMPEENFLYWDDTEWGVRCNLAGYQVASLGSSVVAHAMGAKKEDVSTFATYYAWRNWIVFFLKYTKPEHLSKLCNSFLDAIFDILYEGMYRGEENRAKTVMFAYDDAIHLCMGKARDGMIFDTDHNEAQLEKLAASFSSFLIETKDRESLADSVTKRIVHYHPDAHITHIPTGHSFERYYAKDPASCRICLCESLWTQQEFRLGMVYIDESMNVLYTEKDISMVQNYASSKQVFIASQKCIFLHCAAEVQKQFPSTDFIREDN